MKETPLLDREVRRNALRGAFLHGQRLAGHDARRHFGQGNAGGLGNERHGARGPRIDLEDENHAALYGELDVHQTDDVEGLGQLARLHPQLVLDLLRQAVRGQRAAGVAGMHAGLFDVFHDAADQHVLAVADRIDVHLDGQIQKAIQQHRAVIRHLHGVDHVLAQVILVEHHLHCPAAQDVARPNHQRKTRLPAPAIRPTLRCAPTHWPAA